jgi:hypothetical protein
MEPTTQAFFTAEVCSGPGLVQMIAIKRYFEHFELSLAILFSQRKIYS